MKKSILVFAILWAMPVFPEVNSDDPARPTFGQTGQLFALKFEPKSKKFTVSLAGEKVAVLAPSRITVIGRQFPISGKAKDLAIEHGNGFFQIIDSVDPNARIEIEVKDRSNQKTEKFNVEIKGRP